MNSNPPGENTRRAADLIALLVKAPRTIGELAELAQITEATADRWICALADEGLVVQDGKRVVQGPKPARVWKWAA